MILGKDNPGFQDEEQGVKFKKNNVENGNGIAGHHEKLNEANENHGFEAEESTVEIGKINGHSIVESANGDIKKELEVTNGGTNNIDVEGGKPDTDRAQWGGGLEFLMSCIAMSVGLGNIWRFPFTAYENGGGAFLIPYLIVLVVVGRPVYYMEMAIGQFTSRASVKAFGSLAPAIGGIGYGQLLGNICVATYYCSLMALTLFYLVNSFTSDLPWSECRPEWEIMRNVTCIPSSTVANSSVTAGGGTASSSELYFTIEVLKEKINIEDGLGDPEWRLTVALLVAWILTYIVTRNGVSSSGKASYFLALFPYVILITLLVRAYTLDGASEGFMYFITPKWDMLKEAKVWYAAVSQCFFSLNVGFGTITMYSSYNSFNHNIYRDALVVTTLDTFTSILAGATIFGILGNLAFKMKVDIDDVVKSGGAGLAFISYPEAIAKFEDVPWLFAILFFFMLFILGVGSLVALQGAAFTIISDNYPKLKLWQVSGGVAIGCFLIGLVYVTPGGQYILTLVDYFGGTFIFFILITIELVTVFWWYGLNNFCDDIEFMLKRKIGLYWRLCWGVLTPVIIFVILIYFLATLEKLEYNSEPLPDKALLWGWVLLGIGITQPPIWWGIYLYKRRKIGFKAALKESLSFEKWGPINPTVYEEYKQYKEEQRLKREGYTWKQKLRHTLLGD